MPFRAMRTKLGATRVGQGERTIVLANGLGTSQDTWRFVLDSLASRAVVVRFDHAGMSPATEAAFDPHRHNSLHAFADDVLALLDEQDLRDVLMIGHSVSGTVGAIAAAAAPERIARLVTIGASARYLNDTETGYIGGIGEDAVNEILTAAASNFQAWASGYAPMAVGVEGAAGGVEEFTNYLLRMRPDIALQTLRSIFYGDYRDVFRRVSQPVTVVQSAHDMVVPQSAAEFMRDALPRGELVVMQARGHVPQRTAPQETAVVLGRVIDQWLES